MSLSYRKRGKVWHVRGTVRVGRELVTVKEHSTGCTTRADAEAVGAAEEERIRKQALNGPQAALNALTLADAFSDYIEIKNPPITRIKDISELNDLIGHFKLSDANEAWRFWRSTRGKNLSDVSLKTWRAKITSAINVLCDNRNVATPKISKLLVKEKITSIYLTGEEQEKLLSEYPEYARPLFLTLCFQGIRSGEAARLEWRYIDFNLRSIFIHRSKSGRQRSIPMHPRVYSALHGLWMARGQPNDGKVFLTRAGKPYAYRPESGAKRSPFYVIHSGACKRVGIKKFTPHGWRHHWASWMVMRGCDLVTLMKLGGWSTLSTVQRYAAVSASHLKEAIHRLE